MSVKFPDQRFGPGGNYAPSYNAPSTNYGPAPSFSGSNYGGPGPVVPANYGGQNVNAQSFSGPPGSYYGGPGPAYGGPGPVGPANYGGQNLNSQSFSSQQAYSTGFGGGSSESWHKLGEELTGGQTQAGYLAVCSSNRQTHLTFPNANVPHQLYLQQLQSNPMRTKMLTSGILSGSQEFLASWIAHDKGKHGTYLNSRVPKMALYGAFISAPLGHLLISILQKMFSGKTSVTAKVLQILVSNLIVRDQAPSHPNYTLTLQYRSHPFRTQFICLRWQ